MKAFLLVLGALVFPSIYLATDLTCTRVMVPLELSAKADWPLTVIYDAKDGRTCLIDWGRAGHDPLKGSGCEPGGECRVIGSYRNKIGQTYFIVNVRGLCRRSDWLAGDECRF
jgi:hypothetical protein